MNNKKEDSILIQGELPKENPYVSIVIPTYKRPDLLKQAIDSALNQKTKISYEILVIDDDPTRNTETEELLKTYNQKNILYYKNKHNMKAVKNWNQGFTLANGEYITMLHDDDLLHSNFLEKATKKIKGNRICLFRVKYLYENSDAQKRQNIFFKILRGMYNLLISHKSFKITPEDIFYDVIQFTTLTPLYNKKAFVELGGFKEDTYPSVDHYFNYEYYKAFGGIFCYNKVATYRYCNNASYTVGVDFPYQTLDLNQKIIKDFPESNLSNLEAQAYYNIYIKNVSNFLGLKVDNILPEELLSDPQFLKIEKLFVKKQKRQRFKNLFK